jgi:hypothetical protein
MRLRWRKHNFRGREDLNLHDSDDAGDTMVGYIRDKTLEPLTWVWMSERDNLEIPDLTLDEAKKAIKAMVLLEG